MMQVTLTAKLKLHTTPDQFQALRRTQLAYRDALNFVSQYAFAQGKLSNKARLQEGTYPEIRARFGLPAQMACSVPRQVGATYQTLWTKVQHNAAARAAGYTKKRYKGLDQPPKFRSPTLTYQFGHDYSFKTAQHVSILTLEGRVIVSYTGYAKHVVLIQHGAEIGAAHLWYDRPRKQFYLLVALELHVADPAPADLPQVVGVDVGQRYLAVTTTTTNETAFYSGNELHSQADHYARLRKRLQAQGTRSATHRLVALAGRERRFKQDGNHCISRRIVDTHPHSLIGLEDLTHIRDRTRRTHGKPATPKQRQANRHAAQWAFAELQADITYKAALAGSRAIQVDADYTSQSCPKCGYVSKANRPDKGLVLVCQQCRHTLHADLVGARNVTLRTRLIRQDWMSTGVLSERPDVSDGEAKAARLRRYAELRWSPDTSSRL